jgi:anti-sigma28 factor (negative regulator of flagellin synthesis)
MKIPGSTGDEKKINVNNENRISEQTSGRKLGLLKRLNEAAGGIANPAGNATDSFTVSEVSSQITTELDPTKMAEERRKKVEDIKKRIQNGTYQPPLTEVARSMSEELSLEILLSDLGGLDQETDNGLL